MAAEKGEKLNCLRVESPSGGNGASAKDALVEGLMGAGVIQRGWFTLKSGERSDLYVDFRRVVSFPQLFEQVCARLSALIPERDVALAGVPTAAVPFVALISHLMKLPMVTVRGQAKEHGLGKMIEGDNHGHDIVLIEDIVTTGASILQTIKLLTAEGKKVRRVVTILDRRPAHSRSDTLGGYPVQSLFTVDDFCTQRQVIGNDLVHQLLEISRKKRSNLVLSVDLRSPLEVLKVVDTVGPHVCAVKLHLDIMDFKQMSRAEFATRLHVMKSKYGFLVIEDRKFADIGAIAKLQLQQLLQEYPNVIDIVTTHCVAGVESLAELDSLGVGLLPVCELSAAGNLIDGSYTSKAIAMLPKLSNVVGTVAQNRMYHYLTFCPGINLDINKKTDHSGQTYRAPKQQAGDFFIVGRGILQQKNILAATQHYQSTCWHLNDLSFTRSKL